VVEEVGLVVEAEAEGVEEAGPEKERGLAFVLTDEGGLNIMEGIRGREEEVGSRLRRVVGVVAEERDWEGETDLRI